MIAFVDVQYRDRDATAACVLADVWGAALPVREWTRAVAPIAPYEPGAFYKRELPCLLAVLADAGPLECVVIDGYVFLESGAPGLGAKLYDGLGCNIPVIGLAKTRFKGAAAQTVQRPGSTKPLFLTCVGIEDATAAQYVAQLHGNYRIPTLVRRVDQLARGVA